MKTAISIPTPLFETAEGLAKQLGISRSELYARALATYVQAFDRALITQQLNQVYEQENSTPDPVLSRLQWLSLPREEW
jgi:hypothetical protein